MSPAVVAELAAERHTIAVHEAGHVVVGAVLGIPLHEVWLAYRVRNHLLGRPTPWVEGRTEVAPRRGTVVVDEHAATLFAAAGVGAEAMHLVEHHHQRLRTARRTAASAHCNRGDMAELSSLLRGRHNTLTRDTAEQQTHDLLRHHWGTVQRVATELRHHGRLDAREIRRIVGTTKGPTR